MFRIIFFILFFDPIKNVKTDYMSYNDKIDKTGSNFSRYKESSTK